MRTLLCLLVMGLPVADSAPRVFQYDQTELTLRSSALKEATVFKVDVYILQLFLTDPDIDSTEIPAPDQVKAFRLTFLRNIARKTLAQGWLSDLHAHCAGDCEDLQKQGRVLSELLPDIHKGDTVTYVVMPERVDILVNDVSIGVLHGAQAGDTVTAAFVGPRAEARIRDSLFAPRALAP